MADTNFDHRKRVHTTGLCIAFSGETKELDLIALIIGFDIILFVLPWSWSSSRLQPGVVSDLTPRKMSIVLDSCLSQVSVLGITMRCYQRGVGICFSSRRLNGFIMLPTLFFIAIACFLTTWYDSYGIFEHHTRGTVQSSLQESTAWKLCLAIQQIECIFSPAIQSCL